MLIKHKVLILGYGEMGHAMEYLLAERHDVRIWDVDGVKGRYTTLEDEAREAQVILYCLPVNPHAEITHRIVPYLTEDSLCITIAKGLDESGQSAAQVFDDILAGRHHYGVMYGPMISEEIRMGRPAFADVALSGPEQFKKIHNLFQGTTLICRNSTDMHGRAWSVILKNVYAILFGVSDELGLGANMRGHLLVAAMAELSAIVQTLGGDAHTPYSYAGLGDLLATASSEESHHHTLGRQLAAGNFSNISGEGVHTLMMVEKYVPFDWKIYPLFTLAHAIVMSPERLHSRMDSYLAEVRRW